MAPAATMAIVSSALFARRLASHYYGTSRVEDPHWFLGVMLELIGTFFNLLGKQAFRQGALSGKWWWVPLGFVGWYILYPICDVLALNYAPSSLVFAVDGIIVVWNVLLAPQTLGEPVTVARLTAAALITLGTFGVGGFGSHTELTKTLAAYNYAFSRPSAAVYFALIIPIAAGLWFLRKRYELGTISHGFMTGAPARELHERRRFPTPCPRSLPAMPPPRPLFTAPPLRSTGVLAGWFGGCGIFQKAAITLITHDSDHAFKSGWLYLYSGCALVALLIGVVLIMDGFKRCVPPAGSGGGGG